jgi:hypothetical protein
VNDIERRWVLANEEQVSRLTALQQRGSKKEVEHLLCLLIASVALKGTGYHCSLQEFIHFSRF